MAIPDRFIEELKFKNDLVNVVSSYVTLKRQGRNFAGLCPFHTEKTPSFNVFPGSESFYCFGCGVGGDVITFIERIENLDYIESVKFLADKSGMIMPESDKKGEDLSALKRRIYEINRESAKFFNSCLYSEKGRLALVYLKNRGLTDKTIRKFGLGFAPGSRADLINYLKSKGFKPYEIVQANVGVLLGGQSVRSRFFDRVIFPIIDLRGNVIAFGGRAMTDIKPKYLNTSDTLVFKKSSNLFSLNFAKNEPEQALILVEGYMDVIALYQAGFKNAVATLGTALTQDQARVMSRYAGEIVVCYDADQAGQKAAERAIELLRQTDVLIRVLTVKGAKDPDEFIRSHGSEGPVRFKKLMENCCNDVEYVLAKEAQLHDIATTDGKIAYLKSGINVLTKLSNKAEQEIYAIKLSEIVGVDKSTIMDQLTREQKKNQKKSEKREFQKIQQDLSARMDNINTEKSQKLRAAVAEEALIAFVMNNGDMAEKVFARILPEDFCTEFNRKVYSCIYDRMKAGRSASLSDLTMDFLKDEISKIAGFLASELYRMSTIDQAFEYISVILHEKERLLKTELSLVSEDELLEYMQKLRKYKE